MTISRIPQRPLLVVIHDVAPVFCEELRRIVDGVRALTGDQFCCAVTPAWGGKRQRPAGEAKLDALIEDCAEWLLHGWTHRRTARPGVVSLLTHRSDEFGGLSVGEIQDRINRAQEILVRRRGGAVAGLVPPAWTLSIRATQLTNLSYVMRYTRLECCVEPRRRRALATYSFDWGRVKQAAWAGWGAGWLRWRLLAQAIPCVVLHPMDVARGWLPQILRIIQTLLDRGYTATTPAVVHAAMSS